MVLLVWLQAQKETTSQKPGNILNRIHDGVITSQHNISHNQWHILLRNKSCLELGSWIKKHADKCLE